jgi:glycosyltransferase 2 family protein
LFTRKLRTGLVFSLVLAFAIIVVMTLYADAPRLVAALVHFRWGYLPLILGLTLFNYFWRFVKWQYYLKRLGVSVHWSKSLLIFVSGLSMAITPGKVGELLKSYLLKRETGAAISHTSPIIVAERLTDGIAMLVLAAAGLVLYRSGWEILLALLVLGLAGILLVQNRRLVLALLNLGERLPVLPRFVHLIRAFYESTYALLRWRPLLLAILIGLVSWSGECGALYFVFTGFGIAPGVDLFIKATFILAIASLVGSASGLPGGLGAAEGSVLGLTLLLVSTSAALGAAATLLIRFCTLWFGLGLGVIALLVFSSTRHTPLFRNNGGNEDQQSTNSVMPLGLENQQAIVQTVPVSANNGDRVS